MLRLIFCTLFFVLAAFGEEPKAVYLSWQRQPDATMIVQWITPRPETDSSISVRRADQESIWKTGQASYQPLPNSSGYALHRIELTDLDSNTEYLFRIGNEAKIYKFLTMPKTLKEPIRFVVGGDIYHDELKQVIETNIQAAKQNPRFAILGGDIAYATNRFFLAWEKGDRWIDFLSTWTQTMVDAEGHLIPLIAVIGNHDVTGRYD